MVKVGNQIVRRADHVPMSLLGHRPAGPPQRVSHSSLRLASPSALFDRLDDPVWLDFALKCHHYRFRSNVVLLGGFVYAPAISIQKLESQLFKSIQNLPRAGIVQLLGPLSSSLRLFSRGSALARRDRKESARATSPGVGLVDESSPGKPSSMRLLDRFRLAAAVGLAMTAPLPFPPCAPSSWPSFLASFLPSVGTPSSLRLGIFADGDARPHNVFRGV